MALPAVLVVLIVVVPAVFALFLRSHAGLRWLAKLQAQKQAQSLAVDLRYFSNHG